MRAWWGLFGDDEWNPVEESRLGEGVADLVTTPESGAPLDKIIAAFEKKQPSVTVKNMKTTFDDSNTQLPLQLVPSSTGGRGLLAWRAALVRRT
ncbi:hypothetical protein [Agromyces sp. Root81]|uniref:hypothetical protein n=1 Tax=Agromyces sp. Root81 TaxID=1736601 RepID=UPI000A92005D|nr:hypothetical protein [Agromyces sp. Root81]